MDSGPIVFDPIFQERVWGGRKLELLYGKKLPPGKRIGESWEVVDRPEAQSIVERGQYAGRSLHDLWVNEREDLFGAVPSTPRFPLLIKLLDCEETLSLQVHPPEKFAALFGGEPKTEFWYVADATVGADVFFGLKMPAAATDFANSVLTGAIAQLTHRLAVKSGDALFVPAGRLHAIGAGNIIVEVQQNSDTTYRVFDWDRRGPDGRSRELHLEQALQCIDFGDCQPGAINPNGESLLRHKLFAVDRWDLAGSRELVPRGQFAIACCLNGSVTCGAEEFHAGDFFLLPAESRERIVERTTDSAVLLRMTIPPYRRSRSHEC